LTSVDFFTNKKKDNKNQEESWFLIFCI
jgi:hypothetical protein